MLIGAPCPQTGQVSVTTGLRIIYASYFQLIILSSEQLETLRSSSKLVCVSEKVRFLPKITPRFFVFWDRVIIDVNWWRFFGSVGGEEDGFRFCDIPFGNPFFSNVTFFSISCRSKKWNKCCRSQK
ncbi:hypothetical protein TNCV_770511 [Trichonephila clavipes]|nr:hypothetical protein TNCV_770511 [Trichonephila clavipes]